MEPLQPGEEQLYKRWVRTRLRLEAALDKHSTLPRPLSAYPVDHVGPLRLSAVMRSSEMSTGWPQIRAPRSFCVPSLTRKLGLPRALEITDWHLERRQLGGPSEILHGSCVVLVDGTL